MAELTLHFELPDGADTAAAASGLQQHLDGARDIVEYATVDADQGTRFITGVEIVAGFVLAGKIAGSISAIITAIEKIQQLAVAASKSEGFKRVLVDIGLRSVPLDSLTDADKRELATETLAS